MARKKPEFISGMTKGQEILLALWQTVEDLGGSEDDILRLRDDDLLIKSVGYLLVDTGAVVLNQPEYVARHARNPAIRLQAVQQLNKQADQHIDNQRLLGLIATEDEAVEVRDAARSLIFDHNILLEVILKGHNGLQGRHFKEVGQLADPSHLLRIALEHQFQEVQIAAIKRMEGVGMQSTLADVVIAGHVIGMAALQRVKDPEQLARILVESNDSRYVAQAAVELRGHPDILVEALIEREMPPFDLNSPDWYRNTLFMSLSCAKGDTMSNLYRIAKSAKLPGIACRALQEIKIKGAFGKYSEPPTEDELKAWRKNQTVETD